MAARLRQVGTISSYVSSAFAPDGQTLYVNHGSAISAYPYPSLSGASTVYTAPGSNTIDGIACDDAGTVFWWEDTGVSPGGMLLYRDTSDQDVLTTTVDETNPETLCWSPYDGMLYSVGVFDVVDGETLRRYDPSTGAATILDYPTVTGVTAVNAPVPTLDGGVWWSTPNPSLRSLYRWDIPTSTLDRRTAQVDDGGVPRSSDELWLYGDPSGAAPAGGYRYDFEMSREVLPVLDSFTPGVRACAYTPTLRRVCFQRGATGEVWTIDDRRFWVGSTGFSR